MEHCTTCVVILYIFITSVEGRPASNSFPSCEKNTCSDGNTSEFSLFRNCQCDVQCSKYGDCCQDSEHFSPSPLSACIQVGNWNTKGNVYVDSYYMVNTCPSSWQDEDTSHKCQNFMETIKQEPLLGHPITSRATNITYVNYHCAKCNNDLSVSSMVRWRLGVTCGKSTPTPFPDVDTVLSKATVVDGSWIKPKFNVTYHTCNLYVWRPFELLRRCYKATVDKCSPSWTNDTVRTLCETYTSLVFFLKEKPYRNPYCATCNNVKTKFLYCEKEVIVRESRSEVLETDFSTNCQNIDAEFDPLIGKCVHRNVSGKNYCNESELCEDVGCSKLVLMPSNYILNDDLTATDITSGRVYSSQEYRVLANGYLEVCGRVDVTKFTFDFPYSPLQLTLMGLAISVIGTIMILFTP